MTICESPIKIDNPTNTIERKVVNNLKDESCPICGKVCGFIVTENSKIVKCIMCVHKA